MFHSNDWMASINMLIKSKQLKLPIHLHPAMRRTHSHEHSRRMTIPPALQRTTGLWAFITCRFVSLANTDASSNTNRSSRAGTVHANEWMKQISFNWFNCLKWMRLKIACVFTIPIYIYIWIVMCAACAQLTRSLSCLICWIDAEKWDMGKQNMVIFCVQSDKPNIAKSSTYANGNSMEISHVSWVENRSTGTTSTMTISFSSFLVFDVIAFGRSKYLISFESLCIDMYIYWNRNRNFFPQFWRLMI